MALLLQADNQSDVAVHISLELTLKTAQTALAALGIPLSEALARFRISGSLKLGRLIAEAGKVLKRI